MAHKYKLILTILNCLLFCSCFQVQGEDNPMETLQRVIIDTDIDSDVDDVGALAMLYNLHNQEEINLLGVIVTSDDPYAPRCISALNTYYGLESLPIGFLEDQETLTNHSRYTRQIAEEFPRSLNSWEETATSTSTYRRLLAESPDNSVTIITIGHLTSLQYLLQSQPDEYSDLDGIELVDKKIKKWICMGGRFPEGKEANFYRPDPASTVYCLKVWSKEVIFCGWEIGNLIITGDSRLHSLSDQHPVYRSYELFNNFAGRASWDQVAVFLLTDKSHEYFYLESDGYCHVHMDGYNKWIEGAPSNHSYIKFKEEATIPEISNLITGMILGYDLPK